MNEKLIGTITEINENDPTLNEDSAIKAQKRIAEAQAEAAIEADTRGGGKTKRLMGAVGISDSGVEAIASVRTPKIGAYTLEERFPSRGGGTPDGNISVYDLDADVYGM